MTEYVITLMVTAAFCSLAIMLSPEGGGGLGNYTRLAASLCVLCVVISPIASFLDDLYDIKLESITGDGTLYEREELQEIYTYMLCESSEVEIADELRSLLCGEFGIKEDELEVFVFLFEDQEVLTIKKVTVALLGSERLRDPHRITGYLTSLLECECEIVYR